MLTSLALLRRISTWKMFNSLANSVSCLDILPFREQRNRNPFQGLLSFMKIEASSIITRM